MDTHMQANQITFDQALRHAVDGVFMIDQNRQVVYFSEACERFTGESRASVLGASCACHTLTGCEDEQGRSLAGTLCPSLKIFDGELASYRQRMAIQHRDGRRVWVETTYSPVKDASGVVTAVVGIMRDITEAKEREEGLRGLAGAAPSGSDDGSSASSAPAGVGLLDHLLGSLERKEILSALERSNGQRTLAARVLGISRSRLYRRMEALGIDPRQLSAHEVR